MLEVKLAPDALISDNFGDEMEYQSVVFKATLA